MRYFSTIQQARNIGLSHFGETEIEPSHYNAEIMQILNTSGYSGEFAMPQNRYALCGFYVVLWDRKSGAEFFYSDTALILLLVCFSSIAFLHRFCRLAPIEALPQTPQGTLSLDPASPLTPGLSLRFISRYARC